MWEIPGRAVMRNRRPPDVFETLMDYGESDVRRAARRGSLCKMP